MATCLCVYEASLRRNFLLIMSNIAIFQESTIRRTWHQCAWWFSVIDVVGVLSESTYPRRYWSDLKRKLAQEAESSQPYEKIVRLKLRAPDGKSDQRQPVSPAYRFNS